MNIFVNKVAGADVEAQMIDPPTFTIRIRWGRCEAKGRMTGDGKKFVVLAGSTISRRETNTMPAVAKAKREELQSLGVLNDNRFEQDYVFRSASAAAAVICGKNANANEVWKGLKEFTNSDVR